MSVPLRPNALLLAATLLASPTLVSAQAIRTLPDFDVGASVINGSITRTASEVVFAGSSQVIVRGGGGVADPWVTGFVARLRTATPSGLTQTPIGPGFLNQVSADGSVFVGAQFPYSDVSRGSGTAIRGTDTPAVAVTELLPTGDSAATGISADNAVAVGWVDSGNVRAARWVGDQGAEMLGFLPGKSSSQAYAASADGSVVVGESAGVPFRWTSGDGMVALPLPAGATSARAVAVSADGATVLIAPTGPINGPTTSALWTQGGGLQSLGGNFTAVSMSPDATRVFGQQGITSPSLRAQGQPLVWTSTAGLRTLQAVAKAEAGLNLDEWSFRYALAMSPDGTAFAVSGSRSGYGGTQIISLAGGLPNVPALVTIRPTARTYFLPRSGVGRARVTVGAANASRIVLTATGGFRRTHRPAARPWVVSVPIRPGMTRVRVEAFGPGGRAVARAQLKARRR